MKRTLFFVCAMLLGVMASAQNYTIRHQGKVDGYKILISSVGICPPGFTCGQPEHFFSSYSIAAPQYTSTSLYGDTNDWLLSVEGTQHAVWIDSSTNVLTSGNQEAFKLGVDSIRNLSIDGRLVVGAYARILAGLDGWATGYMLITK